MARSKSSSNIFLQLLGLGSLVLMSVVGVWAVTQTQLLAPRAAQNQNKPFQAGAYFFYWHDCPSNNCDLARMPHDKPTHLDKYSSNNLEWYKAEFKDMETAGLDMFIPVSWGSGHPGFSWFHDNKAVPLMVQALDANQSTLKIAYFDDTNSQVAEWNLKNGRGYSNPTTDSMVPKMPLSNSANWGYFYDLKLKPFYNAIPQKYWATHNGKAVANGGRPLVIVYDASRSFENLEQSDEMWAAIKASFKRDFNGVEPFLILDYSWLLPHLNSDFAKLEKITDAKVIWSGGNDSVDKRQTLHNYTTVSIDPGFECPGELYAGCVDKPRNLAYRTNEPGNEGIRLRTQFQQLTPGSNLVLIETWNELWEGSSIASNARYPKNGGGYLPADYYIKLVAELLQGRPSGRTATPTPSPQSRTNTEPVGNIGAPTCTQIKGWTCDEDSFATSLAVDVYEGAFGQGGTSLGSIAADRHRSDGVAARCGNTTNHGFVFNVPARLKDGQPHQLYFYAHNAITSEASLLSDSPVTVQCAP